MDSQFKHPKRVINVEVYTREAPGTSQGLLPCADVYLNSKFVILTRQGPSP